MAQVSRTFLLLFFALALCGAGYGSAVSEGTILVPTGCPVKKEKSRILVQTTEGNLVPQATVTATYRPGSRVEVVSEVGTTDEGGKVDWTPKDAGIVSLRAAWMGDDGNEINIVTNVSVKFASPPVSGILILVLAGILLIGGSIFNFARGIRGEGF